MITALATQEELFALKNELERVALNLSYHVNSSLGPAHAIELVRGPADDGEGNDLRIFQDDHGHAVSGTNSSLANYIRFVVNGSIYYAPCIYTDPGAQPPTTGIITSTPPTFDRPTNAALITDYVTFQTAAAQSTNQVLLDHIGKGHETAHITMTAVPSVTTAPDGHVYGDFLVRLQFKNVVYAIPCHSRLGGPLQAMRGMNLLANINTRDNTVSSGHDDTQHGNFFLTLPTAGTKPYTIVYQISSGVPTWDKATRTVQWTADTWADLTDTTPGWHTAPTAKNAAYDISVANTVQMLTSEGSDDSLPQFLLRAKVTNPAGTAYTNYAFMRANDEDGSWIFGGPGSSYKTEWWTIVGSPPLS